MFCFVGGYFYKYFFLIFVDGEILGKGLLIFYYIGFGDFGVVFIYNCLRWGLGFGG